MFSFSYVCFFLSSPPTFLLCEQDATDLVAKLRAYHNTSQLQEDKVNTCACFSRLREYLLRCTRKRGYCMTDWTRPYGTSIRAALMRPPHVFPLLSTNRLSTTESHRMHVLSLSVCFFVVDVKRPSTVITDWSLSRGRCATTYLAEWWSPPSARSSPYASPRKRPSPSCVSVSTSCSRTPRGREGRKDGQKEGKTDRKKGRKGLKKADNFLARMGGYGCIFWYGKGMVW